MDLFTRLDSFLREYGFHSYHFDVSTGRLYFYDVCGRYLPEDFEDNFDPGMSNEWRDLEDTIFRMVPARKV